ncbi:hypothetical protein BK141_23290 [Paenibacillus sp. FSL R5-0765]|nr:hypothetical protein BK141_23290 [Paenibacillus sp. FSL R5-0765]
MVELILVLKLFLALIFLSSSIEKMLDMNKHKGNVRNYNIVPKQFLHIAGVLDVSLEFLTGIGLILGLYHPVFFSIGSLLLLVYTIAITINLLRGKTDLSCGCNGMVGNHNISWVLVMRNIVLVGLCLLGIYFGSYIVEQRINNASYLLKLLAFFSLVFIFLITQNVRKVIKFYTFYKITR